MPTDWSSSLLEDAVYDRSRALLELSFWSGVRYRYLDVPAEVYDQLLRAESKGKYFNVHIRNRYAYTKIPAVSKSASSTLDR